MPAGSLTSESLQFTARMARAFQTPEQFAALVIAKGKDDVLIRLGDVARVEAGAEEDRNIFRGNGVDTASFAGITTGVTASLDSKDAAYKNGKADDKAHQRPRPPGCAPARMRSSCASVTSAW